MAAIRSDTTRLEEISPHLSVFHGAVNTGVIRNGNSALLIDCGDGEVRESLAPRRVDAMLFTHHHRDQACGASELMGSATRVGVPAAEAELFSDPGSYWNDPARRWHVYSFRPQHLVLAEPLRVDRLVEDGDVIEWGPARITVLSTPGHTDGGVSYVVDVDQRRVIFCGDLIYDGGRIWDLFSLQKGVATSDYHGFLGSREELIGSLRRVGELHPHLLVPSHGEVISEPLPAMEALANRLRECYRVYTETSATRHYWPHLIGEAVGDGPGMPFGEEMDAPSFLRHFGTSWVILSESGAAFVMDCGEPVALEGVRSLVSSGEAGPVEGLWITHYHDDHVDSVPDFQREFDCPCFADEYVAAVITSPLSWRLPCISPAMVRVDRVTRDGESWDWREFRMTAYHFPGQALNHGALLVEGRDVRMLFVGDSFTPSGMDDYCPQNRNFLGEGVGYDRCISLVEQLRPDVMFNPHVGAGFRFGDKQLEFMRANLARRQRLYEELLGWEDINRGLDDSWVSCYPYEQHVGPGDAAAIEVVLTNHLPREERFVAQPVVPSSWGCEAVTPAEGCAPPGGEGRLAFELLVPAGAVPARYVVPVNVQCEGRRLARFAEAVIVVGS